MRIHWSIRKNEIISLKTFPSYVGKTHELSVAVSLEITHSVQIAYFSWIAKIKECLFTLAFIEWEGPKLFIMIRKEIES